MVCPILTQHTSIHIAFLSFKCNQISYNGAIEAEHFNQLHDQINVLIIEHHQAIIP